MPGEIMRILISIFILLMIFWMIYYDTEPVNPVKRWWIPKLQGWFMYFGLTYDWKMFSPNPTRFNSWPNIKMTLNNGDFWVWEPTPAEEFSVMEKFRYKKYSKIYTELARAKSAYHIKRDFIEYLLHKYDLKELCVKVEIYRVYQYIPPYDKSKPYPQQTYKQLIFTFNPVK